jgi:predicted DNA-binding transcriptional regulator AlpA
MKRRGITGKLVTVPQIAALLGRSRQTALMVSQHWSFPVPIDVLNPETRPMAVWWRKDVEKWIQENPDAVKEEK